ncbi:MAG TPA: hypothetical protein VFS43_38285 [Polyangiaceae bacterium]|nr:hypothetical protein [Polyangiaceae bacterium]
MTDQPPPAPPVGDAHAPPPDRAFDEGGRPTKLTDERMKALVADIELGMPLDIACETNGICLRTFYYWLEKGRADDEAGLDTPHSRFLHTSKRARGLLVRKHLLRVDAASDLPAGEKDWRASLELLGRILPKHFAKRTAVEVTGKDGGPVESKVTDTRAERFAQIAATVGPDASLFLAEMKRWPGSVEEVEAWRSRRAQATAATSPPPEKP